MQRKHSYLLYLLPVGVALAWHVALVCGLATWRTLDAPVVSLRTSWNLLLSGSAPLMALLRVGAVLLVGGLTGAALAISARPFEDVGYARLRMLRSLPFLMLAPLLVMLSGPPHATSLAVIALNTAWPVYGLVFWGLLQPRSAPRMFEKGQADRASFEREAKLFLPTLPR